eukprot:3118628-Prymnesium_polylepis.1
MLGVDDAEERAVQVGAMLGLPTLLLVLVGWCLVVASIILDGVADRWNGSQIANELSEYSWRRSTADAVIAAFLSAALCSWATLAHRPARGLALSALVFVTLFAKAAMLERAGAATWCAALSSVSALFMA